VVDWYTCLVGTLTWRGGKRKRRGGVASCGHFYVVALSASLVWCGASDESDGVVIHMCVVFCAMVETCVRGRVGRWPWVAVGMHVWSTCLWHCLLAQVGETGVCNARAGCQRFTFEGSG